MSIEKGRCFSEKIEQPEKKVDIFNQRLAEARGVLIIPSEKSWDRLKDLINSARADVKEELMTENELAALMHYIEPHLESWDDEMRIVPTETLTRVFERGISVLEHDALAPLARRLVLDHEPDSTDAYLDNLLSSPALKNITHLVLSGGSFSVLDLNEKNLEKYPIAITQLHSLDISENHIGSVDWQRIMDSGMLNGIKELNFSFNRLSIDDVSDFLKSEQSDQIESLDMMDSIDQDDEGFFPINLEKPHLNKLRLSFNEQSIFEGFLDSSLFRTVSDLEIIYSGIPHVFMGRIFGDPEIAFDKIDLNHSRIGGGYFFSFLSEKSEGPEVLLMDNVVTDWKDFDVFINSVSAKNLKQLDVSSTLFDEHSLRALGRTKNLSQLEMLDISSVAVNETRLADFFRNVSSPLSLLTCDELIFTEDVMKAFSVSYLDAIKTLSLSGCRIGDERTMSVFSESSQLESIENLKLSRNQITDESLKILLESSHLKNINKLNLASNQITDRGLEILLDSSIIETIKDLDIRGNLINLHDSLLFSSHLKAIKILRIESMNASTLEKFIQSERFAQLNEFEVTVLDGGGSNRHLQAELYTACKEKNILLTVGGEVLLR